MLPQIAIQTDRSIRNYLLHTVKVQRNKVELASIQIQAKVGDIIEKFQTSIGIITQKDGKTKHIKSNVSGKIHTINDFHRLTDSSIIICQIQQCDHSESQDLQTSTAHQCEICGEEVWMRIDKNLITTNDVKQLECNSKGGLPSTHDLDVIAWEVKLNETVLAKTIILKGKAVSRAEKVRNAHNSSDEDDDEEEEEEEEEEIFECFLNQPVIIREINQSFNRERTWLFKYQAIICSHHKIKLIGQDKSCDICKQKITEDLPNMQTYYGLGSDSKNYMLSQDYAESQKKEAQLKLTSSQRLILVLDLDNTVLHAVHAMTTAEYSQKGANQGELCEVSKQGNVKYVVRLRPHLKEFLEQVLPHYEIYVYTMGLFEYASGICEFLRTKFEELLKNSPLTFSNERIISREAFINPTYKDLNQILPDSERFILALDDRPDVWIKQPKNLVTTLPYIYWTEGASSWNYIAVKAIFTIYQNGAKFRAEKKKKLKQMAQENKSESQTGEDQLNNQINNENALQQNSQSSSLTKMEEEQSNTTKSDGEEDSNLEKAIATLEADSVSSLNNETQNGLIQYSNSQGEEEEDVSNNSSTKPLAEQSQIIQEEPDVQASDAKTAPNNSQSEKTEKKKDRKEIFLHSKEFTKENPLQAILAKHDNQESYGRIIKYNLNVLRTLDNYLLFAGPLLKSLHETFYSTQNGDIREIFQNHKKTVLANLVLVFKPNCYLYSFQRARALGATVFIEGDDLPSNVDYFIIKQSDNMQNPIGSKTVFLISEWIDYCWFYTFKLQVSPFIATSNKKNSLQLEQEIYKLDSKPSNQQDKQQENEQTVLHEPQSEMLNCM